jgi:hypothetical protein
MSTPKDCLLILLVFVTALSCSCHLYRYTDNYRRPTVSVGNFENKVQIMSADINYNITEKIKDKVRKDPYLKFVTDSGTIQLEGSIKSYTIKPISIGPNQKALLNRVEILVDAKRISAHEHEQIMKKDLNAFVDYDANLNYGTIRDSINDLLTERMADQIYYEFFMRW